MSIAWRTSHVLLVAVLLGAAGSASSAPADFSVSSGDQFFRLSDARGKFVALHFLLKTECPYCAKYVAETLRRAPEVAGVVHVFLKPDSEAEIKAWSEKLKSSGTAAVIYRDPDARLANEFEIPGGFAFHGQTVNYPALVLLGPDGKEVFRHVGKDNTDRLPFETLAQKVDEFSKYPGENPGNLAEGALALKGHDPVAYFESAKAEPGKPELTSAYRGAKYRFATPEHRLQFATDPQKFAPAYGGWCATAMAEGRKVEIDPTNFKVTNGRLFLFYKGWLGNALTDWNKDEAKLTGQADEHWRRLSPADAAQDKR